MQRRRRHLPAIAEDRAAFVPLALATGTALVVFVAAGVSLPLAIAVGITAFGAVAAVAWRRLQPAQRAATARRVGVGVLAGIAATAAYDLVRPIYVWVADLGVSPFKAFELFGLALVGERSTWVVLGAGTAFHIANGIGFAVAYCLLVRRPGVVSGVVFALALEVAMLVVYPAWLGLGDLFGRFVRMSLVGHLVYGLVLGGVARALVSRDPTADPPRAVAR